MVSIDAMYGLSDSQLELKRIQQEREEAELTAQRNVGYAAKLVPTAIKTYKSEQQIQAKEMKGLQTEKGTQVYQTSSEYAQQPWYNPKKYFTPAEGMVEYTPQFTEKVGAAEIAKSPFYQDIYSGAVPGVGSGPQPIALYDKDPAIGIGSTAGYEGQILDAGEFHPKGYTEVAPFLKDPAAGIGSKMKALFDSTASNLLKGSKIGGGISAISGGVEMTGKDFRRKSDAYKAATAAQTATGALSLVPGMQWMSLVSGGLGLGKGLFR